MSIMITGANGQLGTELRKLLDERGQAYHAFDAQEMDITDATIVQQKFEEYQPTVVYHCAAYTAVDNAEEDGKELNHLVNVVGTQNIAEACEKYGATLIFISTDYVFDGKASDHEYLETDEPNPLNQYGISKIEAEKIVEQTCSRYYIVRTSWVFGEFGKNFVFTMQRLAKEHDKLTVVNDQFGRPTWTRTLAEFITHLVTTQQEYGVYHLSNDNACTWYEFASEILKNESVIVEPVDSSAFPQKATRPQFSVMSLEKAKSTGFTIPTWQEALDQFIGR